ncbi:MAG: UvrD-helicase domain-containing protein [Solirubrobacteraceae bacterium]
MTGEPPAFDVCDPLRPGVTVLEASAGTGKTHTIASLAARCVAEGVAIEQMLIVTFTRNATSELRERVRGRLVAVERGLARVIAGADGPRDAAGGEGSNGRDDDRVVALLARGDAVRARHRLGRALASFDGATIATTHAFCQEMLSGLGVAGDLDADCTLAENLDQLVDEVVDDLYLRRFHGEQAPGIGRRQAGAIARAAIGDPDTPLATPSDESGAMRVRLAQAVRSELNRRKRAMAVITYDDLVTRLRAALTGPASAVAADQLRDRYSVVLVDEFQDTDPDQWEILRRAFGDGGTTVILIADPKQAIFAFRGADVYAYLDAARTASARATLTVNWRSDQPLIDALDALLGGIQLGHEGIVARPVHAAPGHERQGLTGAPEPEPLRFRVAPRDDPSLPQTPTGYAETEGARRYVAADAAAEAVALLRSDALVAGKPVRPADLAVLVRTHRQAGLIREALHAAGVPAVVNGSGSVFATEAARDWLTLLRALERPAATARARAAALTPFVGWSPARLDEQGDHRAWEDVHARLHRWSRILRDRGVASLLTAIEPVPSAARAGDPPHALAARLLAQIGGERRLTDLRHIARLLHGAATEGELGPAALTGWLRTRIAEADRDVDEERTQRLESDAAAVQVLTIHRSKGLEFPVVLLPYLWDQAGRPDELQPIVFHDPDAGDARTLDVSLSGRSFRAHRDQALREERGEDLRLAYVALTRARHQAVVWWAGSWGSSSSALGRILFGRGEDGEIAQALPSTPADADVIARLRSLAAAAEPGRIAVAQVRLGVPDSWSPPLGAEAQLDVANFDRGLDLRWRRTSYSAITAAAHEAWVASEPEEPAEPSDDDPAPAAPTAPAVAIRDGEPGLPSPLADLPAGADVGTLVHAVLQATDFAAADLDAELALRVAEARAWRSVRIGPEAELAAGLRAAIETPLGSLTGGARLRDVRRADRLDELEFELPLAGGDRPRGAVRPARIAALLRQRLAADDPLAAYADRLADPALEREVRGYLTGSLDLVVRLRDGGEPRFAVIDYKTNRLAPRDEPLTVGHYRPAAVAAEMLDRHYALQALLYLVALHRFLRWRVPGYDPDRQLAGAVYLFLRGMSGPAGPAQHGEPYGVFGWRPAPGLVPALSDLLDGGR